MTSEELVTAMRKGRNELAKVALKERHILAEHAVKAGKTQNGFPSFFFFFLLLLFNFSRNYFFSVLLISFFCFLNLCIP